MHKDISRAQEEVWEWKQTLHDEIKEMPLEVGILYIQSKGAQLRERIERLKKSKTQISTLELDSQE